MTWRELSDFLHVQRQSLSLRPLFEFSQDGEKRSDTFKRLEKSTRGALDGAVRKFAEARTWPALTDEQKLVLYFRLSYGVDLAIALSNCTSGLFPAPAERDREMIEWALIEAWNYPGLPHTLRMSFREPQKGSDGVRN